MSTDVSLLRNPDVALITSKDSVCIVSANGKLVTLENVETRSFSGSLAIAGSRTTRSFLESQFPVNAVDMLIKLDVFVVSDQQPEQRPTEPSINSLVVCLTGAIGIVQMFERLLHLRLNSVCRQIDVVLSEAALKFVKPDTFRSLGFDVWVDPYANYGGAHRIPHITLAKRAQAVLVMPCSAHSLFKIAYSVSDDFISLVCTATTAPVIVAPSMNADMWVDAGVAENVHRIRKMGMYVIEPGVGRAISGDPPFTDEIGPVGSSNSELALACLECIMRDVENGAR